MMEADKPIAVRNKCIKCKDKWKDLPGTHGGVCPSCGSKYFKWSSYEFDKKKNKQNEAFGNF